MTSEPLWTGWMPRECGEHRTVGPHRAWCFDCSEWCYPEPEMACARCRIPMLEAALNARRTPVNIGEEAEPIEVPLPVHPDEVPEPEPAITEPDPEPVPAVTGLCGRCSSPVARPGESRPDGRPGDRARFCDACIDRCHEATDFAHICEICASPGEAARYGWKVPA
ncbi:MAG TPA: hypothetical protein VMV92_10100 [Streptosporangiaceae bacterium]|nr:hypothetical protein [Streptosporangiaceae bacterium]